MRARRSKAFSDLGSATMEYSLVLGLAVLAAGAFGVFFVRKLGLLGSLSGVAALDSATIAYSASIITALGGIAQLGLIKSAAFAAALTVTGVAVAWIRSKLSESRVRIRQLLAIAFVGLMCGACCVVALTLAAVLSQGAGAASVVDNLTVIVFGAISLLGGVVLSLYLQSGSILADILCGALMGFLLALLAASVDASVRGELVPGAYSVVFVSTVLLASVGGVAGSYFTNERSS